MARVIEHENTHVVKYVVTNDVAHVITNCYEHVLGSGDSEPATVCLVSFVEVGSGVLSL